MESLLGGKVFRHSINSWQVSWESQRRYRHWCIQEKLTHSDRMLVVMKNPGSLSGDGSNLRRDSTLRILRTVGEKVGLNQLVINLFDYATPNLAVLHKNWHKRDRSDLVYDHLDLMQCRFVLYAYGDPDDDHLSDYRDRISHPAGLSFFGQQ